MIWRVEKEPTSIDMGPKLGVLQTNYNVLRDDNGAELSIESQLVEDITYCYELIVSSRPVKLTFSADWLPNDTRTMVVIIGPAVSACMKQNGLSASDVVHLVKSFARDVPGAFLKFGRFLEETPPTGYAVVERVQFSKDGRGNWPDDVAAELAGLIG